MNKIIDMNNQGVACLQEGKDRRKAIATLYGALRELREYFHLLDDDNDEENTTSTTTVTTSTSEEQDDSQKRPMKRRRSCTNSSIATPTTTTTTTTTLHDNDDGFNMMEMESIFSVSIERKRRSKESSLLSSSLSSSSSSSLSTSSLAASTGSEASAASETAAACCENNLFSFYRRAFVISHTDIIAHRYGGGGSTASSGSMIPNRQQLNRYFIILSYNIGLALHEDGLDTNKTNRLLKALNAYDLAVSLVALEPSGVDTDDMFPVLLALANNLGHIHSFLLNFQETRRSLGWLRELRKTCQCENLSEEDYCFFFTDVLVLQDEQLSCAPAA